MADQNELEYAAKKLVEKVWQGDESRLGLSRQCASVVIAALQDYTAEVSTPGSYVAADGRPIVSASKPPTEPATAPPGSSLTGQPKINIVKDGSWYMEMSRAQYETLTEHDSTPPLDAGDPVISEWRGAMNEWLDAMREWRDKTEL